jgi:peptidylprolyl isomerase
MIPGFEQAVLGMRIGENQTVTIPTIDAYGAHRSDLIQEIDREDLPTGLNPEIGQNLQITQADGRSLIVTVIGLSDTKITIDANHPLAGEDLTFEIELVAIQ